MERLTKNSAFYFLFLFTVISNVSCSKDDESTESIEITVTASDFTTTMDENPTNGQVIGQIEASTNEGELSFTLTQQQNPAGALAVNVTSGELTVADATLFDFETNPTITGTLKVANGDVSENVLVKINLIDLNEEKIYEGDVILKTQEEVNIFGANGYTRIAGTLTIGLDNDQNDITSLNPLLDLLEVDGFLSIRFNKLLNNLDGLQNLKTIGDYFTISENESLKTIGPFENLITLDSFSLYDNASLNQIKGFNNVISLEGDLQIIGSPSITKIEGFNSLITLKKLTVMGNDGIETFSGFNSLQTIDDHFSFQNNKNLTAINGFNKLQSFRRLSLQLNSKLENLEFNNLNPTNQPIVGITIYRNDALTNINFLKNASIINGNFFISYNSSLKNLSGLVNLNAITETLMIGYNDSIENLDGLQNISHIGEDLRIFNNVTLTDFCGLTPLVTGYDISGYLEIYENAYNPSQQDIIDGNCSL
ncbi:hypothetical protein [uncultured Marixanthomonas sp.]|uniref:hypothetical protein n=1 Tax=uncultured Marixanthomonas sp. TaxID=757245 RepID=UPI0030D84641